MSDVVVKSGRQMDIGGIVFEVRGEKARVQFVDIICEANHHNGIVHMALAASYSEFGNPPVLEVQTRIRMTLTTAQNIHNILGQMIKDAFKEPGKPDKKKAN